MHIKPRYAMSCGYHGQRSAQKQDKTRHYHKEDRQRLVKLRQTGLARFWSFFL